jgi:O-antigen ligase
MALLALPFRKWTALALAAALVLLAFIYLPPDQLIARFAGLASTDEISGDTRVQIWSETLRLIAAYPVFGCGLGGYHSAFLRYKQVAPASTVDFAHNDYLQFLAELGIIGFAIAAALILSVLFLTLRALSKHTTRQGRALALASIGGLAAILLHSLVDFNLYVPANALLMTWIAALAATLMFSSRPLPAPRVIEVKAVATG